MFIYIDFVMDDIMLTISSGCQVVSTFTVVLSISSVAWTRTVALPSPVCVFGSIL